jgi:hypothetical protein
LKTLQISINTDIYTKSSIEGYTEKLNEIVNSMNEIDNHHNILKNPNIIDCQNCLTLLAEIIGDLYNVLEENTIDRFKRQHFVTKIRDLIKNVSECETRLKN